MSAPRQPTPTVSRNQDVTLGILAGGAGSRFGGQDKGWIAICGQPQIVGLLRSLGGNASTVIVSANRNLERYRGLGVDVVCDTSPGFAGPLAGVTRLLEAARTPYLITIPVDAYDIPADLIDRMATTLRNQIATQVVTVVDADGQQPLFAGYSAALASAARIAFDAGERSVLQWQHTMARRIVELPSVRLGNRNHPNKPT